MDLLGMAATGTGNLQAYSGSPALDTWHEAVEVIGICLPIGLEPPTARFEAQVLGEELLSESIPFLLQLVMTGFCLTISVKPAAYMELSTWKNTVRSPSQSEPLGVSYYPQLPHEQWDTLND